MTIFEISSMKNIQKGTITPGLIVVSSAFIIAIYAILFVLTVQLDFAHRQVASEQSLHIAEAGINYYIWHLSKDPNDYHDGLGSQTPGPFVHDFKDPQKDTVGKYSIEITQPDANNIVTIKSTGWMLQYPKVKRTIVAQYGKVSLGSYAFVNNTNLWFGNEVTVNGKVHSNGGIRQDGTNTSNLYSAKSTYICGLETGCPNPEEKPGIWGQGEDDTLWEFPVPPIDFDSLNVNFNTMKEASLTASGVYLGPGPLGYHIVFASDGSFSIYEVTGTNFLKAFSDDNGCEDLYQIITNETLLSTYNTTDKNIVFSEANVWVEGVLNGVVTVAAARLPLGSYTTSIWLPNNLTYVDLSGNSRLGLIAQTDIVIMRDVPDNFTVMGAVVAKDGKVIRHHYNYSGCRESGAGATAMKNQFDFYGTMVSNKRSYWNHSSGGGQSPASGFVKSTLNFDTNMGNNPAPYFPDAQYQFLSWREE